jgi:hypothetical protein
VLGRDARRAALIGLDLAGIDTERFGKITDSEREGTALPPDSPADMLIDWRHELVSDGPNGITFSLLVR